MVTFGFWIFIKFLIPKSNPMTKITAVIQKNLDK